MDFSLFLIQTLNGLQLGVLLFLLASGLTLIFGIMDLVNLAHGSLYMIGAFFAAWLTIVLESFVAGVLLALPLTALFAWVLEIAIVRRLYARDHPDHILATFGLILCLDTLVHMVFGPEGYSVPLPSWLDGRIPLPGDGVFPTYRLVIILAGLLIAMGLYWLINHTRMGMRIRAGAANGVMAAALGIDIRQLFMAVFVLGSVLAGFAGMLIAPINDASIGMGNDIIITAFVVVIIGGLGSMKGAFVAAILIGLIDTLGRSFLDDSLKLIMDATTAETAAPAISSMLIYILMAVILALRPQGLFPPVAR
uniref:Amino acid/amide ABC transporter membrane protein 1, HAAT family n=1 Tax=Candidatus Kentrum sp. TUN TaxID=2126343 RepID=A0A450ZD27_9GAMM|nr:MAG: amino acid/amide ABC transporter membrane protein 1, HAAT family [Candidatus Kentron sp. TUN]VFK51681.1 MAG: amino acid/amide ABC transporter membrane protein 1, HAAT family [Candidatus Kentron sp. TUN]VFK56465.1 MAG: amino acid/amide ABC transporter membrane protein 1, HAAT family [Candidatus Kentron sp. TUN]